MNNNIRKNRMYINYIANWDRNRELTWSGTTYSLLTALESKSTIYNININNSVNHFVAKVDKKIASVFGTNLDIDFLYRYVDKRSKRIVSTSGFSEAINVQIHSLVDIKESYIYEDLIWEALQYTKEKDPKSFAFSGFQNIDKTTFSYNLKRQSDFLGKDKIILSMSHWLTNFINEKTPHRAVYVGGGINVKAFSIPIHLRDAATFLFVGKDFYRKGGDLVVAAFQKIKQLYPEAKLIIAGPDSLSSEITAIKGIQFVGNVSVDKVSQLMASSTIFVMPSRFEAYGLVFIEAMAMGMPIIVRDKYEMPHFVLQGAGMVMKSEMTDELEISNLVTCMSHMLEEKLQYLTKARELSPKIIAEYSWESVANRIISEIQSRLSDNSIQ